MLSAGMSGAIFCPFFSSERAVPLVSAGGNGAFRTPLLSQAETPYYTAAWVTLERAQCETRKCVLLTLTSIESSIGTLAMCSAEGKPHPTGGRQASQVYVPVGARNRHFGIFFSLFLHFVFVLHIFRAYVLRPLLTCLDDGEGGGH